MVRSQHDYADGDQQIKAAIVHFYQRGRKPFVVYGTWKSSFRTPRRIVVSWIAAVRCQVRQLVLISARLQMLDSSITVVNDSKRKTVLRQALEAMDEILLVHSPEAFCRV